MGKLIKDLNTISSIQSDDLILVERNNKGHSIKLSDVLSTKQDVISDLATYAKISDVESMIDTAIYNILNTPI